MDIARGGHKLGMDGMGDMDWRGSRYSLRVLYHFYFVFCSIDRVSVQVLVAEQKYSLSELKNQRLMLRR
jgi:hypothetical protein